MTKKSSSSKSSGKSSAKDQASASAPSEQTFDERLEDLEQIAAALEGGELGLEQALQEYRRGVQMLRTCRDELKGVRAQVEELSSQEGAAPVPYDGDPDGPYDR